MFLFLEEGQAWFSLAPISEFLNVRASRKQWLGMALISAFALNGCDNRPAPSPLPNPFPQKTLKLKITVEKSMVNRVEVHSLWVVGNLGCAPTIYPAGNKRVKQVDAIENVEKFDGYYMATVILDRFVPDKCSWVYGGADVKFFHNKYLLSSQGSSAAVLRGERIDRVTCLTRLFSNAGVCGLRDEEAYYKREDKNAFNATVELSNKGDGGN